MSQFSGSSSHRDRRDDRRGTSRSDNRDKRSGDNLRDKRDGSKRGKDDHSSSRTVSNFGISFRFRIINSSVLNVF